MKITVENIILHDGSPDDNYQIHLSIGDQGNFLPSADIIVWIPKRDASISDLKQDALQAAYDFLKSVLDSRS